MNTLITPNFSLEEFCRSQTAARLGIDNTPPPHLMPHIKMVCGHLETIRRIIGGGGGIRITSGYRSPAVNRAIGGVDTSAHCQGLAADIEAPRFFYGDVLQLCKAIAEMVDVPFDQLIYEYGPNGWAHVGFSMGTPRREVLTKLSAKSPYTKGLPK